MDWGGSETVRFGSIGGELIDWGLEPVELLPRDLNGCETNCRKRGPKPKRVSETSSSGSGSGFTVDFQRILSHLIHDFRIKLSKLIGG